jgi:tRNA(His) 5'-end guanylyltransferase
MGPHVPKLWWTGLGNGIKHAESTHDHRVPAEKWYTLRLDGTGFSKFIPRLRKRGVFAKHGYCPKFAHIMCEVSMALMTKFNAVCAYTQSDEITLVVKPIPLHKHQEPHIYSGALTVLSGLVS